MEKKSLVVFQIVFIILNALSGVYYSPFYMGQWKQRVALFGIVTVLFVLLTAVIYIISIVKRRNTTILMVMNGIFCIMQFFPMLESFMLSGNYLRNAIFHIAVLVIGIICVCLSLKTNKERY